MARSPSSYTAALHKECFEKFALRPNISAISTEMDIVYTTVLAWSKEFRCPLGCPWHNYAALLEERTRVLKGQMSLIEQGVGDNEVRRIAAESALNQNPQKKEVKNALLKVVKTDLDRLAQLELLYNK